MSTATHAAASRRPAGRGGVLLPLGTGALGLAAAALLAVRSPYEPLSYGICPSVLLLGVSCPGCGGLRATHDLLTGDLVGAWQANPLWVVVAPLLLVAWAAWTRRRWRGAPPAAPPAQLAWVLLVAVVLFGVLRNVPALSPYLGPAPLP
ncbi:DUF2752 domain-containing protein [Cellulomonas shaoxiangyii]|uniref:DUF2752 domain-containing protein n=1 Tax=Cellulomonas shaoxiangyii TaxID=2566013 RepID=A0A4P7SHL7_9CELL|nr:DUF2752 domain-containing protein [Cellulomonas shaoxiangyii]QCB93470.1 DUF2752 domain-containing protein [Cellulomonas shaoxiangyii]TGY86792.1 DUF2752 domain-containing protein [Cellulomonas shaoxiangyii]